MFSTTPEEVWTLEGGLWHGEDGGHWSPTCPAPTSPEKEYELALLYWTWMVHHGAPEAFCTLFRILSTATASEAVAERLFSKESMWYAKRRGRMTTKYASSPPLPCSSSERTDRPGWSVRNAWNARS